MDSIERAAKTMEVKMSNRLFQGIVHKMGESITVTVGVIDAAGEVVACSDLSKIGEVYKKVADDISFTMDTTVSEGMVLCPIGNRSKMEFAVFAVGTDELARNTVAILAIALDNVKTYYDDKYDKANFIKGVILDNILPTEVYSKSKELRFSDTQPMVAFFVRFSKKPDVIPTDVLSTIFSDRSKDYVIGISDQDVALVKSLSSLDSDEAYSVAKQIIDTISAEFYVNVAVGVGSVVMGIKDLGKSYKEAQMALEIGKVFDSEKAISTYETLGIGRLIYHLPTTLCDMFLNEVMKDGSIEALDRETLLTIQCFFQNSLNVSETSRKLFIHRNTLVYRLEKIKKLTGLDLREFEAAITFKVALMVKKCLASKHYNEE